MIFSTYFDTIIGKLKLLTCALGAEFVHFLDGNMIFKILHHRQQSEIQYALHQKLHIRKSKSAYELVPLSVSESLSNLFDEKLNFDHQF